MQYFLVKTEPSEYSIDDLAQSDEDFWDGVNNYQAIGYLKSMKVGDRVLIYHSGKDSGIVGLAKVSKDAVKDPKNPKSWIPTFKFITKLEQKITLEEIKTTHLFDDWALVRQSRLSVMPVPDSAIIWLKKRGLNL